jgi:hypothetical protein
MKMGTKGQKLSLLPSVILTVITLTVYLRTADFIWHSNSDYGGQKKYDSIWERPTAFRSSTRYGGMLD